MSALPRESNTYTTTVNGTYDLTGKLFLSGQVSYAISDYETLISSQVASANLFINYVYSPKLVIGLGATGGVNSSDGPTSDETFEQMNVRANYIVSGKISLSISGGLEFRQFGEAAIPFRRSMKLQDHIAPSRTPTITIAGSRRTDSSASLAGQDYSDTTISLTFSQRLFSRVNLSLGVGYTNFGIPQCDHRRIQLLAATTTFISNPRSTSTSPATGALAFTTCTGRIPAHLLYSVFTIISSEFVPPLPSSSCSPACS